MSDRESYCLGEPLRPGTEPVLLIDDAYIEDRWGVYRHVNKPLKHPKNPVLTPDELWESISFAPSVLYDHEERKFRMWYGGFDLKSYHHQFDLNDWKPEHGQPYYICYAESSNGVDWIKPRLKDKPFKGFPETNVVYTGTETACGTWVLPNHPSTGRPGKYVMCFKTHLPNARGSLCLAYSDDGIHWQDDPKNPIIRGVRDTRHHMVRDDRRNRWLFFTRPMCFAGKSIPDGPLELNYKRRAAVAIGETPQSFHYPRCILWPDETEAPDYDQFLVSRVGSHFIAGVSHMDSPPDQKTRTYLASSVDGLHWNRQPNPEPWLDLGPQGHFDGGFVSPPGPFLTLGDTTYLYYSADSVGQQWGTEYFTGIGLAKIQRERFVAQMGPHTGGFLLTREILVEGKHLLVNIVRASTQNAGKFNSVNADDLCRQAFAVELVNSPRDGAPQPIPGFTFADSTAVPMDSVEHPVTWKNNPDLTPLLGKSVYIRFFLKNVGLYSFTLAP
jgi:hypothetical protein